MKWALAEFYGFQTVMVAEARAMLNGIRRCKEEGYQTAGGGGRFIDLQVLRGQIDCPWCILHEVRELKELMLSMTCTVSHMYRESNSGADFLANWGCSHKKQCIFDSERVIQKAAEGDL